MDEERGSYRFLVLIGTTLESITNFPLRNVTFFYVRKVFHLCFVQQFGLVISLVLIFSKINPELGIPSIAGIF